MQVNKGCFPRKLFLDGQRFGHFLVLDRAKRGAWNCRCDCGALRQVGGYGLMSGAHKSCGCAATEARMAREVMFATHAPGRALTHDALKSVLHYEPETGVFTWIASTAKSIKVGDLAGRPSGNGYWRIHLGKRDYPAHHIAWLYVHGVWPADKLDHINLDRGDNRIDNLREASGALNRQNTRMQRNNTSGFKGVSKPRSSKRWNAEIMVNKKPMRLGSFDTPEQASEVYLAAKRKLHTFYIEGQGVRHD